MNRRFSCIHTGSDSQWCVTRDRRQSIWHLVTSRDYKWMKPRQLLIQVRHFFTLRTPHYMLWPLAFTKVWLLLWKIPLLTMVVLKNSSKEPHFYSSSLVAADYSCNIKFEQILHLFVTFNSNSVFHFFARKKKSSTIHLWQQSGSVC